MALSPYRRFRLYQGAGLLGSLAQELGESSAASSGTRGILLAELMRQGKLRAEDLSAQDVALAGPQLGRVGAPNIGSGGGGFLDILGNLGTDIEDAVKGLPMGLLQTAKSVGTDVAGLISGTRGTGFKDYGAPGSEIKRNVIDPTVESYKYTYGGVGAPEGSSIWDRLAEHPLQPILDVATVASLGAGGAVRGSQILTRAGKVAPDSRIGRLGSTTRDPLAYEAETPEGTIQQFLPREYSQRPLRHGLQALTDFSTRLPGVGPSIATAQRNFTRAQRQRLENIRSESETQGMIRNQVILPLVGKNTRDKRALAKLDEDELQAFELVNRLGTENVPTHAPLLAQAMREGLEGEAPEGQNFEDFGAVPRELPEQRSQISDRAMQLARDPSQSENLTEALTAWRERIASRVEPDLDEETINAMRGETLGALSERFDVAPKTPEITPAVQSETPSMGELSSFDWRKMRKAERDEGVYTGDLLFDEPPVYRPRESAPEAGPERASPFAQPTIMPSEIATGFRYQEPGRLTQWLTGRETGVTRERRGRTFNPSNLTFRNLLEEGRIGFRPNPNPILAGVTRPDARAYIDFLSRVERKRIEQNFNREVLQNIVLKTPDGEPVVVPGTMGAREVAAKYGENWVPVNPDYPIHWYRKEVSVAQALSEMQNMGYDLKSTEVAARMLAEAEDAAIDATFAARRMPSWLAPRSFMDYQYKLNAVADPYNNKVMRGFARFHQGWKTATLAMMPRWALNTAVGGAVLNTVKGVGPKSYLQAQKMRRGGIEVPEEGWLGEIFYHGTTPEAAASIRESGFDPSQARMSRDTWVTPDEEFARQYGSDVVEARLRDANIIEPGTPEWDEVQRRVREERIPESQVLREGGYDAVRVGKRIQVLNPQALRVGADVPTTTIRRNLFEEPELAGVEYGGLQGAELLESYSQGVLDSRFGIKFGPFSRTIFDKVQAIDNFFRRASFVHSLRRESQQALDEQGTIIENFERGKGARTVEEFTEEIMENPELVRRTVENVNRFAYNFAHLGPAERRYVRQFIPFWGWYKFISGLAYRLPVDYPGRTNLLTQMGTLGTEAMEEQYGEMPPWLKGAIPLTGPNAETFRYFSTMGINPFSQFFNPAGAEGPISGALQLGQMSPLAQSVLSAYGIDTLRGGQVPISPETLNKAGVGTDWWGDLVDKRTGMDRNVSSVAGGRRLLGTLIRSFPYQRIAERAIAGGRSTYPESLPWDVLPMGTKEESTYGGSGLEILQQLGGITSRPYDLRGAQRLAKKRAKYARTKNRNDLRRLRKTLGQ